jgi:dTMP kinase
MSGRIIVFEGVEGCGKTTQLQLLHEWLQRLFWARVCGADYSISQHSSQPVPFSRQKVEESFPRFIAALIVTREPGGTQLGSKLRQLLLGEDNGKPIQNSAELLLYAADRAQHVEEVLKPQLALGAIILCDRYTDSTIAYQGYGRGLSLSLIHQLNSIATGGLESNLTLWLDVDVEVGLARTKNRGVADRIEQADLEFHRRVQQGYIQLAKAHPKRIVRVDASLSEENVQQQIQEIVSQRLTEWGLYNFGF